MQVCNQCDHEYDPSNINIPNPIPDGMCAQCGTHLTAAEIAALIEKYAPPHATQASNPIVI